LGDEERSTEAPIPNDLVALHQTLVNCFDLEELRTLCFSLNVDYDSLPGEGKAAKARELVQYMQRHDRLDDLTVALASQRKPKIFPALATGPVQRGTCIQLLLEGELASFTDERREVLLSVLASVLRVEPSDVKILRVQSGSIRLIIEIPEQALIRLASLSSTDISALVSIGIQTIEGDAVKTLDFRPNTSLDFQAIMARYSNRRVMPNRPNGTPQFFIYKGKPCHLWREAAEVLDEYEARFSAGSPPKKVKAILAAIGHNRLAPEDEPMLSKELQGAEISSRTEMEEILKEVYPELFTSQNLQAGQAEYWYDAFISYSHVDTEWVQSELLPQLEKAGLKVCIDSRDFEIGVPSLVNMERAVDNSRHTLIVLTPAWVESQWTEFESLLAGTSDPAGRRRRLIPLMLKPCTLPTRIAMLTYADFT